MRALKTGDGVTVVLGEAEAKALVHWFKPIAKNKETPRLVRELIAAIRYQTKHPRVEKIVGADLPWSV